MRSLESLVLYGLKGMAAYLEHAYMLGKSSKDIFVFMLARPRGPRRREARARTRSRPWSSRRASWAWPPWPSSTAPTPAPTAPRVTTVRTGVRDRPGILVSGHDLRDLHDLLEQTKGTGVDVYTHGEMLPAHYYPFFEKYDNLYGNYGGSWWTQGKEIEKFHGPVLFTTNCLVPPREEPEGADLHHGRRGLRRLRAHRATGARAG